ncbi:MAG: polysaccharide biosynthesis protein, partial [Lachnospiraceae bacterium]|nr:polysaccharide biosynthesis protein [Lachnospiraceae bacterium]
MKIEKWQAKALILMVYDVIAVNMSYAFVLWLRFDCEYTSIPREYLMAWLYFVPIYAVFCVIVFWRLHLYNSLWRFASYNEFIRMICATVIGAVFHMAAI